MTFKLGSLNHAKGYAINKLYEQSRFGGKHTPVFLLIRGYPPHLRHLVLEGIEELKKEGIIRIVRQRTGSDTDDHATLVQTRLGDARALLNGFRKAEKMPRLGKDLKTWLPVK